MSKEVIGRDINGQADFSLPIPVYCWNFGLVANTVSTFVTPPNFNRVFFSYTPGTNVFVSYDGNDPNIIPGGGWDFPAQELNPAVRQISLEGGQSLKFISDTTAYVNIRFDVGQQ